MTADDGIDSPYHAGEQAVQVRAGTRERSEMAGRRAIRDHMIEQHRTFMAQLPFIVAGAMDDVGQPWASLLAGPPGFISTPTPQYMRIAATLATTDPLAPWLGVGRPIGLLGIEQHTRRRNRLNGIIAAASDEGFGIDVRQSFGNCPQYIQTRQAQYLGPASSDGGCHCGTALDTSARRLIAEADTFFIASAHPTALTAGATVHGVDVSHRGGPPGFVAIDEIGTLTVPDYAGNGFFNTLGNLTLHPRAGLLFIDFVTGDMLHIAADSEILWDPPQAEAPAHSARRLRLHPRQTIFRPAALPLRWREIDERRAGAQAAES